MMRGALPALPFSTPSLSEHHLVEVGAGRNHREENVDVGEVGRPVDDRRALRRERLGLERGCGSRYCTWWPGFSSRSAIGKPMRPMPIHPIRCVFDSMLSNPCFSLAGSQFSRRSRSAALRLGRA